ncbi:MAG: hypothetical protein J6R15_06780 [Bacteroidales bacterium]|nr:hypothetical protein [Bacteroidales bacterium]
MKKALAIMISVLLPALAWGQAQINTKKVKIGDFTQKTTKVVLSGNEFMDSVLKDEVTARWRISPYEFCTLEEFNGMKSSDEYYFLIITNGQFKKDQSPTLQFLTLVKGGKGSEKGIDGMLEVVSMPIAAAQFPSGREIVFLPAFIDIMQGYTLDSMEKDSKAYGGLGNYSTGISNSGSMRIIFSAEDLAVSPEFIEKAESEFGDKFEIAEEEDVDKLMLENTENAIVSYVVAPFEPKNGAYCYKMLINAQTHQLYYYKRHRISDKAGAGFLEADLERIF